MKQAAILTPENSNLYAEVANTDWQMIIARELYYHRTCYRDITRKRYAKQDHTDVVFQELAAIIEEKVITGCEVLRMADIYKQYEEIQSNQLGEENLQTIKVQSLKEKIQKSFGSKIGFWCLSSGSDYIFNNTVKKGQLVEVAVRAKLGGWQEKTLEEKVTEVAQQIRNELLETPETFSRYKVYTYACHFFMIGVSFFLCGTI